MSEQILKEISKKLDQVVALLAIQGKDIDTQVKILRALEYSYQEIGKLTGIAAATLAKRESRKHNN